MPPDTTTTRPVTKAPHSCEHARHDVCCFRSYTSTTLLLLYPAFIELVEIGSFSLACAFLSDPRLTFWSRPDFHRATVIQMPKWCEAHNTELLSSPHGIGLPTGMIGVLIHAAHSRCTGRGVWGSSSEGETT